MAILGSGASLTNEPRQPKRAIFKRRISIASQDLLHLITLRPLDNLLCFLITSNDSSDDCLDVFRLDRVCANRGTESVCVSATVQYNGTYHSSGPKSSRRKVQ